MSGLSSNDKNKPLENDTFTMIGLTFLCAKRCNNKQIEIKRDKLLASKNPLYIYQMRIYSINFKETNNITDFFWQPCGS